MAAAKVVACAIGLMSCATLCEATLTSSEYFSLNLGSNSQMVCANDVLSKEQFVARNSECAFACVAQKECIQYNYFKTNSTCQLFYNYPRSLAETAGCKSYMNMRIFPSNEVALVGDKVVLECRSSSPIGLWTFTPVNHSTSVPIVKDCAVLEPFADQYMVNTSDGGCNLLINNVKVNQSGTYACKVEQSPELFVSSEIVVLLCPAEFDFVAGVNGCYLPINELLDWDNASARCQQMYSGAYSVIINNAAEQKAISDYMKTAMNGTCYFQRWIGNGSAVWTGGQRQTSSYSSPFVWKPNSNISLSFAFTNWHAKEPSSSLGKSEFCVALVGADSYSWEDCPCNKTWCALCEYGPYKKGNP